MSASPRHRLSRLEHDRSENSERVAEANIRRRSDASRDGAFEDASGEPWQPGEFLAVMIDDRRDAGIGRAQHRPRSLDRAHGSNLFVLLGCE